MNKRCLKVKEFWRENDICDSDLFYYSRCDSLSIVQCVHNCFLASADLTRSNPQRNNVFFSQNNQDPGHVWELHIFIHNTKWLHHQPLFRFQLPERSLMLVSNGHLKITKFPIFLVDWVWRIRRLDVTDCWRHLRFVSE